MLLRFTNGNVHILRNHFFTDFWHPPPPPILCNPASSLSNSPLFIMSISCDTRPLSLPPTKCIIAVFQQPDFPDNLKKYKKKTIQKNSILFKPRYDFKNKKSVYLSWFDLFVSILSLTSFHNFCPFSNFGCFSCQKMILMLLVYKLK